MVDALMKKRHMLLIFALVVELVDTLVLGTSVARLVGSSPTEGTKGE